MANRTLVWCTAAFSLATAVMFALHYAGIDLAIPNAYHFATFQVGAASSSLYALDWVSVVNLVALVFISTILFFGYFAPLVSAYAAAQMAYLFLTGKLLPVDYLLVVPALASLASGSIICQGISDDFNHKGIVYSKIKTGLMLFGLTVILTAAFIAFRLSLVGVS